MRLLLPITIVLAVLVGSVMLDPPAPRAELVTGYTSIETLDPQQVRAAADVRVAYALFEGLCSFDPHSFEVVPGVAKSWDVADDHTTYTFHLRADARWSNGSPVTARDFRFAWKLGLLPDTGPPYIDFLMHLAGAQDYFDWAQRSLGRIRKLDGRAQRLQAARRRIERADEKFDELLGVEVVDRRTLRVELARPTPYFLDIAASWPLFPLHPETIRAHSSIDPTTLMLRRDTQWTRPETIVSNGPYTLQDWRFKRSIRLDANPHYWNAGQVGPRSVGLRNFEEATAMYHGYESGAIDLMLGAGPVPFAPEILAAGRSDRRDDVHAFDTFATYYYIFNCREKQINGEPNPFTDPRLRRALAISVDKRAIVDHVTRLHQTTTDVLVPRGMIDGYASPDGLSRDPQRARELLAEAGYRNGEGLPAVTMLYNTGSNHGIIAQALAKMWQRTLGVEVETRAQEWKTFLRRRSRGNGYHLARSGWFGDYADPTTFLDLLRTGNGNNDAGFSDTRYDELLSRAANTGVPQRRMDLLAEAERYMLRKQAPVIPLFYYKIIHLYDEQEIRGVSTHPRNLQMFHKMRLRGG